MGKKEKGITLIALVLTIIVMLILVAVSINVAVNGGLFKKAGEAVKKTEISKLREDWMVERWGNHTSEADEDLNGPLSQFFEDKYPQFENDFEIKNGELVYIGTNEETKGYTTDLGIGLGIPNYVEPANDGVLANNAKYKSNGKTAIIPKGFRMSRTENTIDGGLVIQDANGNEFVWVPVDGAFERRGGNKGLNKNDCAEPYAQGYEGESDEYNAMKASVEENGGFYIGRYETGSATERTAAVTGTPVVKKDMYPYNYVGWGNNMSNFNDDVMVPQLGGDPVNGGKGAVYLSKSFYPDNNTNESGVISTLCYGVQWDAAMNFVSDETHNVDTDSSSWGNYVNVSFYYKGENNNFVEKPIRRAEKALELC